MGLTTTKALNTTPRIYVACLAAYNNGKLHGEWIDCDSEDEIWDCIKRVLKTSPEPGAEEYAIHDYENFGPLTINEYESVEMVAKKAKILNQDDGIIAAIACYERIGSSPQLSELDDAINWHNENYEGVWSDLEEYAQYYVEETGILDGVPDHLERYFDYQSFGRDLVIDCITHRNNEGIHIWRNH